MKRLMVLIAALLSVVILSACSGSGGTASNTPQATTGKFIDGPVKGLKYTYGNYSGTTAADGSFSYLTGSTVTFKVGDIVIGSVTGKGIITPADLVANPWDASMNPTTEVLNIIRFLLALDDASVAGSLTIPPAVTAAAAGKTINFATATDTDLATLLGQLGIDAATKLPTALNAATHFKESIMQLFIGTYSGTWSASSSSGSDHGTFTLTISSTGNISGTYTKIGGSGSLVGTMKSDYTFEIYSSGGSHVIGTIDPSTGTFAGTLSDPTDLTAHGTFDGTKQ